MTPKRKGDSVKRDELKFGTLMEPDPFLARDRFSYLNGAQGEYIHKELMNCNAFSPVPMPKDYQKQRLVGESVFKSNRSNNAPSHERKINGLETPESKCFKKEKWRQKEIHFWFWTQKNHSKQGLPRLNPDHNQHNSRNEKTRSGALAEPNPDCPEISCWKPAR